MSAYLKQLALVILAVASMMLAVSPAGAENTLEKILSAKKIRVAIDVANPPFGILDKSGQPDGSDVAVARQLAKDMGAEIEFVQVPSTGRIPALLAGRADVTIASISVTTDRAKAVMYCNPNRASKSKRRQISSENVSASRGPRSKKRRSPRWRPKGRR